jgi:hypothetical protein
MASFFTAIILPRCSRELNTENSFLLQKGVFAIVERDGKDLSLALKRMLSSDQQQLVHEYLTPAQSILIFFHDHSSQDIVTAALGLFLQLQAQGKNVALVSPHKLGAHWQELPGAANVEQEVANKNLQISFAYQPEAVDKVSYHIDEDTQRFNLVIQPQKGFKPLNPQTVQFSQTGVEADLIITVGVHQLSNLEEVYALYSEVFENTPVISVNSFVTEFGTIKLETSSVSGYSEFLAQLLFVEYQSLGSLAATNLLAGIVNVTQSFQLPNTSADTLETAAKLLRNGAQRVSVITSQKQSNGQIGSSKNLAEALRNAKGQNGNQNILKASDAVVEAEPVEVISTKSKQKKSVTLNPPPEYMAGPDTRG